MVKSNYPKANVLDSNLIIHVRTKKNLRLRQVQILYYQSKLGKKCNNVQMGEVLSSKIFIEDKSPPQNDERRNQ